MLFTLLVAVAVAAAVVVWLAPSREPAQFVTLGDGVTYRFVGVTWGTNHYDLTDQRLMARLVNHLPPRLAEQVRAKFSGRLKLHKPVETSAPSLCLWLNPETPNAAAPGALPFVTYVYAMLVDGHGVEAGSESTEPLFANSTSCPGAIFSLVPRRSRVLECLFYAHQSGWIASLPGGGTSSFGTGQGSAIPAPQPELGHVRFANPLYGHYPQWQPETLPATKLVGDVEVRLSNCVAGISVATGQNPATGKYTNLYRAPAPGEAAVTRFDLDVVSTHGTNERWTAQSTVLSDATGNALTNGFFISQLGTFWPDERAVRLHVELKRIAGFPATDFITFSNLPIPAPNATNGTALTNAVHGIPILLRNFSTELLGTRSRVRSSREDALPAPYHVELELPATLSGEVIDFIETTTDAGEKLDYRSGDDSGQFRRRSYSSLPAGAKSLNVTVAVQKLRSVDFFVKPFTPK